MAFYLSPSVNVIETDLTVTVPAVPTTITGMVGRFEWGPCNVRVPVTNDRNLQENFGNPNDDNYESWFSAYNFLQYSNNLFIVRVINETTAKNAGIKLMDYEAATPAATAFDDLVLNEDAADSYTESYTGDEKWIVLGKYPGDYGNDLSIAVANYIDFVSKYFTHGTVTGTFTVGEAVTGDNSSATGVIREVTDATHIKVEVTSGEFEDDEGITTAGGSATLSAIVDEAEAETGVSMKSLFEFPPESDQVAVVVYLDDVIVEQFIVSLTEGAKNYEGTNIYVQDYINRSSKYLLIYDDVDNTAGIYSYSKTALAGGVDAVASSGETIAGYNLFKNPEEFDVNMIIDGSNTSATIQQHIIDNICEFRKDCVGYLTVPKTTVVGQATVAAAITDMIDFRKNTLIRSTSYAALYGNWKYQYDAYNDKYRWIPVSADIAGITAYTAYVKDPWFAPAGYNRGLMKNVVKLAINPDRGYRDLLYPENINPILVDPSDGPVVLGQKTLQAKPSAFDRLDVRWLFIVLEKSISTAAKYFMFEKNTPFTRRLFKGMVEPFLRDVQGREGIFDFLVDVSEAVNTPEVIDRNEFKANIYIKPTRTAEFLILNFIAVKTGTEFSEIIGG